MPFIRVQMVSYNGAAGTGPFPAEVVHILAQFAQYAAQVWAHPRPHLRRDRAHAAHICAGAGLTPARSAPGLGSPPRTSAPGLGSPRPGPRRGGWAHPGQVRAGTGLTPARFASGLGSPPPTSAPGPQALHRALHALAIERQFKEFDDRYAKGCNDL